MGLWWPPAAAAAYMRPGASPQSRRYVFTGPGEVSSLVIDPPGTPVTPCFIKRREERKIKKEKFYIYLDSDVTRTHTYTYTHTHPAGAGSTGQPWKARGRKSGHKRRAEGQNSAGGEGNKRTSKTNLHGETDLTSTGHTPKTHDTLQTGTRGRIRDRLGNSWWRGWNKKIINEEDTVHP